MDTEVRASKWETAPLGPWRRYRRDLEGSRRMVVAPGTYGGWVWELWSLGDGIPVCLDMGEGGTAEEAIAGADRATAESAAFSDEELMHRNGLESAYAEFTALTLVPVEEGKRCRMCMNGIAPGLAAAETGGDGWLWCPSCASRNPGSVMADEAAETA